MYRWEYLVVQVGYHTKDGGGYLKWINGQEDARFGRNMTRIYDALQALGAEGWELVGVDNPSSGQHGADTFYIMKRGVPSASF